MKVTIALTTETDKKVIDNWEEVNAVIDELTANNDYVDYLIEWKDCSIKGTFLKDNSANESKNKLAALVVSQSSFLAGKSVTNKEIELGVNMFYAMTNEEITIIKTITDKQRKEYLKIKNRVKKILIK